MMRHATRCNLRRNNERRGISSAVANDIPHSGIPPAQSKYILAPYIPKTTGRQISNKDRRSQGDCPTPTAEGVLGADGLSHVDCATTAEGLK